MTWLDPHVDKYINTTIGEIKIIEIHKHWIAALWPVTCLAMAVAATGFAFTLNGFLYWLLFPFACLLVTYATYQLVDEYRDRFVITSNRAFRVHGVFNKLEGSIPIQRVINLTSKVTPLGRVLNYGHFVFDSAAQNDPFNKIKYVKNINERKKVIQGLSQGVLPHQVVAYDENDGT